jgi:hypothetical protein
MNYMLALAALTTEGINLVLLEILYQQFCTIRKNCPSFNNYQVFNSQWF